MKINSLSAILLALALFTAAYGQNLDKSKLDQFFDRLAEKNKAMGSLTIAKGGKILYTRAIGYSQIDGNEKRPLTAASRFRIASITKMFTAAMIFQLVDEGKLKLTDTLDNFFPQIPNASKITMAHILGHRSGIHDSLLDPDLRPASKTNAVTQDELLAIVSKGKPDFEPDTQHRYSNSGYFLLGRIVEKLTGKPYGEALDQRIASKLGLKDTYTATGNMDVSRNETLGYMRLGDVWRRVPETHPSLVNGGGSIVTTPNDLAKFIGALFDGKIVSKESLSRMKTIRDGEGMGMTTFMFADKTFYGETGGGDNIGAWLAYLPEEKLAVAYTTNAKVYPVVNIIRGVVDIYYKKPFQIPTFEAPIISPEVLDTYVGVYSSSDAPGKITITRKGSTLFFQPPGAESGVALEATAENRFQIEGAVVIEFDSAKNQMTIKRGGGERVLTKEH